MTKQIFKHKFDGWFEADAYRWTNPDGSQGGLVAVMARVHESVVLAISAEVWPDAEIRTGARIGRDARIGDGASIGAGARIGRDARIGDGASIGAGARIGDGAVIEDGVYIGKNDWFFVAGPQGSRSALATAIYSTEYGLRWWVGCQHGITTSQLSERVERDHGASPMGDDYRYLIKTVEDHPGLARAKARIEP